MNRTILSLAAGAVATVCVTGVALAQDASPAPLAAQQAISKVRIASGLVTLGRSNEDPVMLYVAAKLLSGLGADIQRVPGREGGPAAAVSPPA